MAQAKKKPSVKVKQDHNAFWQQFSAGQNFGKNNNFKQGLAGKLSPMQNSYKRKVIG